MKKIKYLLVLATALLLSPVANAQWAVICVTCTQFTQTAALQQTTSMMSQTLSQISTKLDNGIEKIVGAVQGASTAQSAATSENAKLMSEANTRTAVEVRKAEIQAKAMPLDPCGVTAVAKGGSAAANTRPTGSGRGAGGGGGGGGAATPTAGASKEMQETLKISNGERPAPPPELAAALAAKGACTTFAKGGVREQSCKDAGFTVGLISGFPNADVRAETLFDGPQSVSDIDKGVYRKLSVKPGNSPEKMALNAFVRNLETPIDLKTLGKTELNSEAGRNYLALRDSYDAALSLATKPVRDQESMLTANKATLPILKQLLKSEDGAYIQKQLDESFPSWKSDGVSYTHLMSLEASRRYMNESWHARMAGANEKQLLAEQVQLQAFQGWTNVMMLERIQQLSILQGASAGAAIRSEKGPLLIAAHKAAKQ